MLSVLPHVECQVILALEQWTMAGGRWDRELDILPSGDCGVA